MSMFTDFHSHVLPQVDDGSKSLNISILMLQMEAEQGIERVIATPHFYPQKESLERFLRHRAESEKRLREEMENYSSLPELIIGAEVYYFPGISKSDALSELTIGDSRCILIEMPHGPWKDSMYKDLENIYVKRNLIPIVAHIDRYISPLRTYGIPRRLEDLPVRVQANAEFFLNKTTRGMALRMLKKDQIHLLGSDCHNLTYRKPNLGEAIEWIRIHSGDELIYRIISYQEALLDV